MPSKTRKSVTLFAASFLSAASIFGLFGCDRADPQPGTLTQRSLTMWGLWQESKHLETALQAFGKQFNTEVTYKKIGSVSNYEDELLRALAEGRGPDVFVIHHTWIDDKRSLMAPAPAAVVDGKALTDEFVEVVAEDVVRDDEIYALPLSVDTLALYYNKDILNAAGIAQPPETWTEFQQVVEQITRVNRAGTILQSGAALGTAANVNRAPDILQLVMLQSGMPIYDTTAGTLQLNTQLGQKAVQFYTDFANRNKTVYTWNLDQDFSIDAFAEGETAFMLNYSYQYPVVRAKNSRLNFGVAPMPQIAGSAASQEVNFAAYWPYGVSASAADPTLAWQFVSFLTRNEAAARSVNLAQGTPPALRAGVVEFQRDPELGVFADQTLTAKTWRRSDIAASDTIFNELIDDVVVGTQTITEALRKAEGRLRQLQ